MLGIDVKEIEGKLVITWQLSKTVIPLSDIKDVSNDNTYGGEVRNAIRIGTPYGTTDRVVIKTSSQTYILFTTNGDNIMKKIKSFVH